MNINMSTSHPSAFISSTFADLHDERMCVADILRSRGLNVNALDIKPASSDSSKREIIGGIQESDFVILLIGDRYGSILPNMTGSSTMSITWWEYRMSLVRKKPILPYFKKCCGTNFSEHDDPHDPKYSLKRRQFEIFKKQIQSQHNPAYFSDVSDLIDKIEKSLISVYRSGVKSLAKSNADLRRRVTELEDENKKLGQANARVSVPAAGNVLRGLEDLIRPDYSAYGLSGGLLSSVIEKK